MEWLISLLMLLCFLNLLLDCVSKLRWYKRIKTVNLHFKDYSLHLVVDKYSTKELEKVGLSTVPSPRRNNSIVLGLQMWNSVIILLPNIWKVSYDEDDFTEKFSKIIAHEIAHLFIRKEKLGISYDQSEFLAEHFSPLDEPEPGVFYKNLRTGGKIVAFVNEEYLPHSPKSC